MTTPDDNPYAAPQADLHSPVPVTLGVPMAQEVHHRQLFPELSTRQLFQLTSSSSLIMVYDLIYLIVSVCVLLMLSAKLIFSGIAQLNLSLVRYGFPLSIFCCMLFYWHMQRSSFARLTAIGWEVLLIVSILGIVAWQTVQLQISWFVLLMFVWFFAIPCKQRINRRYLYGLDRLKHHELTQETNYRLRYDID